MPLTVLKPVDLDEVKDVVFPMLGTIKIDGIRAYVRDGVLYTCSDAPIPNQFLQQLAAQLPDGADLEFFLNDFRTTSSIVMGKRAMIPAGFTCNIFDIIPFSFDRNTGYVDRLRMLRQWFGADYSNSFYSFFRPGESRILRDDNDGDIGRYTWLFSDTHSVDPLLPDLHPAHAIIEPKAPKTLSVKFSSAASFQVQVRFVRPITLHTREELDALTEFAVSMGLEGVMLRTPNSKYKFGRSTPRSAELIRFKPFKDAEAIVIGYDPIFTNGNDIYGSGAKNRRSSAASGLTPIERLGAFRCIPYSHAAFDEVHSIRPEPSHIPAAQRTASRTESSLPIRFAGEDQSGSFLLNDFTGDESVFSIGNGIGLTHAERDRLWLERPSLIGRIIKFKHLPVGAYDAPRSGIFLSFRDRKDLT